MTGRSVRTNSAWIAAVMFAAMPATWPAAGLLRAAEPAAARGDLDAAQPDGRTMRGEPAPIVVRRMFVPGDVAIDRWPVPPGMQYVPLDPAKFESLWKTSQQAGSRDAGAQGSALEKLSLTGRLDAGLRLAGTAELTVRSLSAANTRISLKPLSPAVIRARWKEDDRPALLGTAPDGTPQLAVEKSGVLSFDWSLAATADPSGTVSADLALPPAAAVSLELEVPAAYDVESEDAVFETRPAAAKPGTQADRRWKLRLSGGSHRLEFRPVRDGAAAPVRQTVRQSSVYELSERGVEASIELRVDALSPLERFDVRLDEGLTLIDARSSDKGLSWTTTTTGKTQIATIELDRPLHGANRSIFLRALGPSTVGVRRRLPIVRIEGLFWQRGSLTIVTPAPLQIDRLDVVDGLAASPIPLTGGRTGEAVEVQCFSPDTTAEVLLSRPAPTIDETSVDVADVRPNEILIQHRCQLQVTSGEVFVLEADVPPRWVVDSVATVPASALDAWRPGDERDKRRRLTLYFAQAITPERPVRLVVTAHARHAVTNKALERADLNVISFSGVRNAAPLAAVRSDSALRREVEIDDELSAPTAAGLDPLRRELLAEYAAEQLLDLSDAAPAWRLHFSRRAPKYDARIEQVASVETTGIAERYRIEVLNRESLPLDRLIVRLRPAKSMPPQWSLDDSRKGRIEARRIAAVGAEPSDDSELWQIDLRRPTSGDVVLFAERATSWGGDSADVSFAAVVDAFQQTGSLVVEAGPELPLVLWPRALAPIPVNSAEDATKAAVRGSYRFDPKETANRDALSMSIVRAAAALPMSVARVWNRRIASNLESGGRLVQRTRLFVHSVGAGRCRLTFPESAEEAAVSLDGAPVAIVAGTKQASTVISFPADRSSFVIDATFSRAILADGAVRLAELPVVDVDVPVLHSTHQLLLPLAYDVPVDSRLRSLADDSQTDLVRRLAGPWAKSTAPERDSAPGRSRKEADAEVAAALRAIGTVSQAARREGRRLTWEELWVEVQKLRTAETPPIRFDGGSLWGADIGPKDLAPLPQIDLALGDDEGATAAGGRGSRRATGDDETLLGEWGEQVLALAGLRLTADEGTLVVSAARFVETRGSALRVFRPQTEAGEADPARDRIDFDAWRREPASPWRRTNPEAEERSAEDDRFTGGAGHVVAIPPQTSAVWLVRREVPATIAFGVVLTAFALGRRLAARRRGRLVILMGAAAAVACLTPTWIGVIATSALIGQAAALAVEIVLPQRRLGASVGLGVLLPAKPSGAQLKQTTAVGLLLACRWNVAGAYAQAEPAAQGAGSNYEIFIPVDAQNRPNGKDYYVPEELRKLLAERAAPAAPATSQPVLWLRADYQTQLARDIGRTRFVAVELKATFELDVPAANTVVRVPLAGFDVASMRPVLVDGRLVDVRPTAGGFELTAPQSGRVRLEFGFRPDLPAAPGRSGFRLDVPPVLDAQLRVSLPAELPGVDVAEAAEPPEYSDDRRTATVRLSPQGKLTVRWDDLRSAAEPSVIPEQLTWLKIRPGSTVVDARFRVRPIRPMSELVLVADPRLQWLPKFGGKTPIDDVRSAPIVVGQASVAERVTVVFAKPITEESLVDVSFLVSGASGSGRLRLPELKPAVDVPQRRYFAYSVDPQLASSVAGATGLPAVAVPEFAKAWGESEGALPQAAYALDGAATEWTLITRPLLPRVRAAWRETLACGRRRIDVAWDAETTVERGAVSLYELEVPREVTVTSVEASEVDGDSGQVLRWSRDDRGGVVVFLRAPSGGKHKLAVRGHAPVPQDGNVAAPIITVRADAYGDRLLQVLRLPDARVALEKPSQLTPYVAPIADERLSTAGRAVATLAVSGAKPATRLRIQPNVDRFKVRGTVTLLNDRTVWDYELAAQLESVQGLVDEINLELPPQIVLPPTVTPPMPLEIVAGGAGGPRRIVLRPRGAIEANFSFTIKAPLSSDPSVAPAAAPRIRGAEAEEYYFRLPAAVGSHVARWDTAQLAPATLPDGLASTPTAADLVVLRSVGPHPTARLHILAGAQGRPYVRFADHRLSPEDGGYFGVSSFLIEPAGMKAFVLRVPPSLEIVQAVSGGAMASVLPQGDSTWKIATASDEMPHFIDVAFRSRTGWRTDQSFATLAVPSPGELRTNRVFWTIVEPEGFRLSPVDEQTIDRRGLLGERIRLLEAVEAETSGRGGRQAADEWCAPLVRRRDRDRQELSRILPEADGGPAVQTGRTEAMKNLPSLFEGAVSPYARTISTSTGELPELTLRIEAPSRAPIGRIPLAAACLAGVVLWRLFRAVDGPMRRPHLVGVLIGAAWLVWLRPPEFGWVIIAAVLATRLHSAVRPARSETAPAVRPLAVSR